SELAIDTAQMRESIVSHAKSLNYVPRSRVSARAKVRVQIHPNGNPTTITIPKHYGFKSSDSSSNALKFITDQPITITRDGNGNCIANNVTVDEGYVVNEKFPLTISAIIPPDSYVTYNKRFVLQSENVDVSSIEVYVQGSEDAPLVQYERTPSLLG